MKFYPVFCHLFFRIEFHCPLKLKFLSKINVTPSIETVNPGSGGSRIFPRGGVNPLGGGREHAKFSRKLHEIERIWTPRGGRASLTPPPRSANARASCFYVNMRIYVHAPFSERIIFKYFLYNYREPETHYNIVILKQCERGRI